MCLSSCPLEIRSFSSSEAGAVPVSRDLSPQISNFQFSYCLAIPFHYLHHLLDPADIYYILDLRLLQLQHGASGGMVPGPVASIAPMNLLGTQIVITLPALGE